MSGVIPEQRHEGQKIWVCHVINLMAKLRGAGRRKNKCSGSADQRGYGWWQWRYGKGYKPEKATSVIYTRAATVRHSNLAPLYAFHSFLSLQYSTDQPTQLNSPRAISGSRPLRAPTRPAEVVPWKASQLARLTTTLAKTLAWQVSRT